MFSKNSRNPGTDQFCGHLCIYTCSHHENPSLEYLFLCQSEKFPAVALAKIEIKKHDVDCPLPQNLQSLRNCAAVSSHLEPGLCSEEATCTLSKQGVIV